MESSLNYCKSAVVLLGGSKRRFSKRLEKALEIQESHDDSLLLITGQDIYSDAETIKKLGKTLNFLCENISVNTLDNAENAYLILKRMKRDYPFDFYIKEPMNRMDVHVVTDTLHMPRVKRYFRKVFTDEFRLYFHSVPEDRDDLYKKIIYESIGYIISFLPREYLNFAKTIKNKYIKWV